MVGPAVEVKARIKDQKVEEQREIRERRRHLSSFHHKLQGKVHGRAYEQPQVGGIGGDPPDGAQRIFQRRAHGEKGDDGPFEADIELKTLE